jgi:hypothetical protein
MMGSSGTHKPNFAPETSSVGLKEPPLYASLVEANRMWPRSLWNIELEEQGRAGCHHGRGYGCKECDKELAEQIMTGESARAGVVEDKGG